MFFNPPSLRLRFRKSPSRVNGPPKQREVKRQDPKKRRFQVRVRSAKIGRSTLLGIDFKLIDNKSRVVVTASEEPQVGSSLISNRILTVDLKNINVPKYLQRELDTSEFKGAVQSIQLKNIKKGKSNDVRILVKLKEEVPYETTREGKLLFIDIENPKSARSERGAGPSSSKRGNPSKGSGEGRSEERGTKERGGKERRSKEGRS